jgi:nucleoid-associated protein YgaU
MTLGRRRTVPPAGRLARLLRGIGALLVLIAVVVGVPLLMQQLNMMPHSIPSLHRIGSDLRQRDNGQLVAAVLAAGVWICWALFTLSLIPELAAVARKKPARLLPGLGVFQRPAGALVAAIAIGFTIAPLIAGVATAARANATPPPLPSAFSAPAAVAPQHGPASTDTGTAAHSDTHTAHPLTASEPATAPTYQVQRRDTLWGIAERFLHDPLRYPEIAQLNPTGVGPDNEITTGTTLTLPADASGPGLTRAQAATSDTHVVTVQVEPGDDLYSIEQRVTGDGNNWHQGFDTNKDRAEPGGEHFTNPDLIKPGWTLDIPSTPSPATTTTPTPSVAPTTTPTPTTLPGTSETPAQSAPSPAQPTPAQPTPSQVPSVPTRPAASAAAQHPERRASPRSSQSAEDTVVAFAGGGLLLAGVSLTALVMYRRRQFQRRSPGRTIGGTPPELIRMERAVLAAGSVGLANVTWLDEALRSLVQSIVDAPDALLPDVIAQRLAALRPESPRVLLRAVPDPDLGRLHAGRRALDAGPGTDRRTVAVRGHRALPELGPVPGRRAGAQQLVGDAAGHADRVRAGVGRRQRGAPHLHRGPRRGDRRGERAPGVGQRRDARGQHRRPGRAAARHCR